MPSHRMPMEFTLTADHVRLIRRMYVGWQDCETGAPEVDPKRPYGNSSVAEDVAEILGWDWDEEDDFPDDLRARAMAVHHETAVALQVVLIHGFAPGRYVRTGEYDQRSWVNAEREASS